MTHWMARRVKVVAARAGVARKAAHRYFQAGLAHGASDHAALDQAVRAATAHITASPLALYATEETE